MNQSLGQLGSQQASDISKIGQQVGDLNIQRVNGIQSLAGNMQSQDLAQQQFQFQQQQAQQDYNLKVQQMQQQAALANQSASGGGSLSSAQQTSLLKQSLAGDIANAFNASKANSPYYTENTVLPNLYKEYGALGSSYIQNEVYNYRKNIWAK